MNYIKLAEEIYCEETCKKCEKNNTELGQKYIKKLSKDEKDEYIKICDDKIVNGKIGKDILKYRDRPIESIRKRLKYLYNKFSDTDHPFSNFPVENYDEHSVEKFIKRLFIKVNNNSKLLYNISKRDIDFDLNLLYDFSDKIVIDPLIENLFSNIPDSTKSEQRYQPIKADIKAALSEIFNLEKISHKELVENKDIINCNKDMKKIKELCNNQYSNHYGYQNFFELLNSSLGFIIRNLYYYNLDSISIYNILLLNNIISNHFSIGYNDINAGNIIDEEILEIIKKSNEKYDRIKKDELKTLQNKHIKIINMIFDINTEVKDSIISYKNKTQSEYIYYGYLSEYLLLIVYSFTEFCYKHLLRGENNKADPVIRKEKLNNLLQEIQKFYSSFKIEHKEAINKSDIFEAFNIFITYLKTYNIYRKHILIETDLLKKAVEKSQKTEHIEKAYVKREEIIYDLQNKYKDLLWNEQEEVKEKFLCIFIENKDDVEKKFIEWKTKKEKEYSKENDNRKKEKFKEQEKIIKELIQVTNKIECIFNNPKRHSTITEQIRNEFESTFYKAYNMVRHEKDNIFEKFCGNLENLNERRKIDKENKKIIDSWQNDNIDFERFITERETKKGTIIDFDEKVEYAKMFIETINQIANTNLDPNSDYDLKLVFREIFLNDENDKTLKLLKRLHNEKGIYKEDFIFLKEKFRVGYFRQYDLLEGYRELQKIDEYLTEYLFTMFSSFDYDTILRDLHKIAEKLTKLLEIEFSKP